ncbi:C40 family peptidase [Nocardia vulneris]|uniref:C40 family peptidase n=1 Tax=Nocardia vulneris TaxID=1141657 RepID=UPI00068AFA69|nr:NlpC/P60 family protein [Nocardia vulneris]
MKSIDIARVDRGGRRLVVTVLIATAAVGSLFGTGAPAQARPQSGESGAVEEPTENKLAAGHGIAPSAIAERAFAAAWTKLGSPYRWGGTGPDAFDCSGLVVWAYRLAGREVPRTSGDQLAAGTPVAQADLRLGDLVSFNGGGHSGLYAGDGNVIHAGTESTGVTIAPISSMPFAGARRF